MIPITSVNAQVDGDMECAEMRGAIKAISAFLDGTFMGLVTDPGAHI